MLEVNNVKKGKCLLRFTVLDVPASPYLVGPVGLGLGGNSLGSIVVLVCQECRVPWRNHSWVVERQESETEAGIS